MELMVDPRLAADVDGDARRGAPAPVSRVEAGGLVPVLGDVPRADAVSCVEAGGSVCGGDAPHRRTSTTLLVIADYDTLTRELRDLRYDDGMPVPPDQIASIAAGARILPAVFSADGDPLWLGKHQRDASTGQRAVLAARKGSGGGAERPVTAGSGGYPSTSWSPPADRR